MGSSFFLPAILLRGPDRPLTQMPSVNKLAMKIVQELLGAEKELGICVGKLRDGSTLLDCGIRAPGGYQAGRLVGETCMGGLGSVALSTMAVVGTQLPSVVVSTDHPLESCILSQLAGWSLKVGKFRAMGSGPARALAQVEPLFQEYRYRDGHSEAVIVLETSKIPDEEVSGFIAAKCRIAPSDLYMIVTPTHSLAGTVQICARIVETGMHRMHTLKVDLSQVEAGHGQCPIPPLSTSDLVMMGRTNDAMLYGGTTLYTFREAGSVVPLIGSIPSSSSGAYGRTFADVFEAAGRDFYKLDPALFSPAVVAVNEVSSGRFFSAGRVNHDLLRYSFGMP